MYKININTNILLQSYLIILEFINFLRIKTQKMNKIDEIEYVRFCKEFDIDIIKKIEGRID